AFKDLEKKLGIKFKNQDLLKEALTHRSYLNENPKWPISHNERLEYLGDAVLELAATDFLYHKFPNYQEGRLTNLRAALVNYQMLAQVAKEISLEKFIFLSRGEAKDAGRARDVILANATEAFLGAVYLDQGYAAASKLIKKIILNHLQEVIEKKLYRDPKSSLQEIIQEKLKVTPTYKVLEETGPDHKKKFLVGVFFAGKMAGKGTGLSKQEAESKAAEASLEDWGE
ncbi:MAG: ribonuclease III, partial [Patescibacteria group bacterium]